jgi:hypothetical protein
VVLDRRAERSAAGVCGDVDDQQRRSDCEDAVGRERSGDSDLQSLWQTS